MQLRLMMSAKSGIVVLSRVLPMWKLGLSKVPMVLRLNLWLRRLRDVEITLIMLSGILCFSYVDIGSMVLSSLLKYTQSGASLDLAWWVPSNWHTPRRVTHDGDLRVFVISVQGLKLFICNIQVYLQRTKT